MVRTVYIKENFKSDKFSSKIKRAICLRASNKCSICKKITSWASKDSADGVILFPELNCIMITRTSLLNRGWI